MLTMAPVTTLMLGFVVVVLLCGNSLAESPPIQLPEAPVPCICGYIYLPVCGVDGKTYPNECVAGCDGIDVDFEGTCEEGPPPCVCPLIHRPVCGVDGNTYPNECVAGCDNIDVAFEGTCEEGIPCICPAIYQPVCAIIGNRIETFSNPCMAECRHATIIANTTCPPGAPGGQTPPGAPGGPSKKRRFNPPGAISMPGPIGGANRRTVGEACICPDINEPVCGLNMEENTLETYSSPCQAQCSGAKVITCRPCPPGAPGGPSRRTVGETCKCPHTLEPVCGRIGEAEHTYNNDCLARCAGASITSCRACPQGPSGP